MAQTLHFLKHLKSRLFGICALIQRLSVEWLPCARRSGGH